MVEMPRVLPNIGGGVESRFMSRVRRRDDVGDVLEGAPRGAGGVGDGGELLLGRVLDGRVSGDDGFLFLVRVRHWTGEGLGSGDC